MQRGAQVAGPGVAPLCSLLHSFHTFTQAVAAACLQMGQESRGQEGFCFAMEEAGMPGRLAVLVVAQAQ